MEYAKAMSAALRGAPAWLIAVMLAAAAAHMLLGPHAEQGWASAMMQGFGNLVDALLTPLLSAQRHPTAASAPSDAVIYVVMILAAIVLMLLMCIITSWCCLSGDDDGFLSLGSLFGPSSLPSMNGLSFRAHALADVDGDPIAPAAMGLTNLGNTCFMNASLQCLAAITQLRTYFASGEFKKHLNTANPLGTSGEMASAFGDLMHTLTYARKRIIAPSGMRDALSRHAPAFASGQQQDVSEFIAALLDKMHEDLNQGTDVLQSPTAARYRMKATSDTGTPLLAGLSPPAAASTHTPSLTGIPETGVAAHHAAADDVPVLELPAAAVGAASSDGPAPTSTQARQRRRGRQSGKLSQSPLAAPLAAASSSTEKAVSAALAPSRDAARHVEPLSAEERASARSEWRSYVARHRSIIADLFQGQQVVRTYCPTPGCGYVARSFETMMYLSLPLPPSLRVWRPRVMRVDLLMYHVLHRKEFPLDAKAATVRGTPLLTEHTVLLGPGATAANLLAVAQEWFPHVDLVVGLMYRGIPSPCADTQPLGDFRSSEVIVYALPELPDTATMVRFLSIITRNRRWTRENKTSYIQHVGTNVFPPSERGDAASRVPPFHHEVRSEADLYTCPDAFPDYFSRLHLAEGSVPLLFRIYDTCSLDQVCALAETWADVQWHCRDEHAGEGCSEAGATPFWGRAVSQRRAALFPTAKSQRYGEVYAPCLRWTDDTGLACGLTHSHTCKFGCDVERFFPFLGQPSAPSAEEAMTAPLTVEMLDAVPDCLAIDWFSSDDVPHKADYLCLQPVWQKYEELAAQRNRAIAGARQSLRDALKTRGATPPTSTEDAEAAAYGLAPSPSPAYLSSSNIFLPDPMAVCPSRVVPAQLLGMKFAPRPVRVPSKSAATPRIIAAPGAMSPALRSMESARAASATPAAATEPRRALPSGLDLDARGTDEEVDVTLQDCLDLYTKDTILSAENSWECPRCKQRVQARQCTALVRAPEVLIVVLKRFIMAPDGSRMDKLHTLVRFPITGLDLQPWLAAAPDTPPSTADSVLPESHPSLSTDRSSSTALDARASTVYDLISVCAHTGVMAAGHYTAYAVNAATGNWLAFNDRDTHTLTHTRTHAHAHTEGTDDATRALEDVQNAVVTPQAYVLVFQRRHEA